MKKIFSLLLVLVLTMSVFTGCVGQDKGDPECLRIGMIGPLSGDTAMYGKAVQYGMEIAVEEINKKAEENDGLKIDIKFQDDENDVEKAKNAYNSLKDWGMQVLAGTVTTKPACAIAPLCNTDKIFMLTPSASAEDVIKSGDNVFQVCFTDPNQGQGSAELMAKKNMGEKIGIIYDSSSAYSAGIYKSFKEKAAELNLNIVCEEAFTDASKSDLTTQVTKCKNAGADLVFLPIYATEASQILKCAKDLEYAPVFFGCDGMDGILEVKGFDKSIAEGLVMMTPFAADAEDELTKSFVAKYKEKANGETPNQFAADGYDVIYALYTAATKAGINGGTTAEEASTKLIEQFTTMEFEGLTADTGTKMTWKADGTVSKTPTAVVIKEGKYVKYDD